MVLVTSGTPHRPGGRSAEVRAKVHRATLELLAEQPVQAITLSLIAQRAGVHQTTLYRRWRTMPRLIEDIVTDRLSQQSPVPDTGSLPGDLQHYARKLAADLATPLGAALVRAAALAPEQPGPAGPTSGAQYRQRQAQIAAMLDRARQRGEPAPTVQEFVEVLLLPMYAHLLFQRSPASPEYALMLADRLLQLAQSSQPTTQGSTTER